VQTGSGIADSYGVFSTRKTDNALFKLGDGGALSQIVGLQDSNNGVNVSLGNVLTAIGNHDLNATDFFFVRSDP
jgi:hypothetical protein